MEKAIKDFLDQRRDAWLKGKIKASMDDEKKRDIEKAAEEKFTPVNWIPDAAKRARQLSMVTHPPKLPALHLL